MVSQKAGSAVVAVEVSQKAGSAAVGGGGPSCRQPVCLHGEDAAGLLASSRTAALGAQGRLGCEGQGAGWAGLCGGPGGRVGMEGRGKGEGRMW